MDDAAASTAATAERILSIPTEQGDVPIDLATLPLDPENIADIIGLLAEDAQPAHYWATIAYEYVRRGSDTVAIDFLSRGSHRLRSVPVRAPQAALLDAMLAAIYTQRARSSPKHIIPDARYQNLTQKGDAVPLHQKAAHYAHATQCTNASAGADPRSVHSQLSRAIDMCLKGATADAERIFTDVAARNPRNCLALLGKGCCMLRRRAFPQALQVYQQALALVLPYETQRDFSRPDPRIGIGLCLAGMGRIQDARRAWTRSAALYPNTAAAPRLLLGLSALNAARQPAALPTGLFGAGQPGVSDRQARDRALEEGLTHIQAAWKLNNRSAMTAIALADHFTRRALAVAHGKDNLAAAAANNNNNNNNNSSSNNSNNKAKADAQFAQALKLGEHAVQYADARSDFITATAALARTAHVAMHTSSLGLCSLDEMEMRTVANRNWTRVVEDLARAPLPGSQQQQPYQAGGAMAGSTSLTPLQALASLSLAQLQLSQSEVVAAMHTLDGMRLAAAPHLLTSMFEPALLEASLRATSHPGASKDEAQRDRQKARVLFERTLALADAAHELLQGAAAEKDGSGKRALAQSRASLVAEVAGEATLTRIHTLGQDVLANVELAQILQAGTSAVNLTRAARRYTVALDILARRKDDDDGGHASDVALASLEIRLRANLGAVLGVRALESAVGPGYNGASDGAKAGQSSTAAANNAATHPLVERALEHLRVALDLIRAAPTAGTGDDVEFEKTTVMFNAARLQESSSHPAALQDARQAYETILQIHPEYIDARARLAIMVASLPPSANVQGKATQLANAYFKEALSSDPSNLDTRAAYVCFLAGELGSSPYPAQWGMIKDTLAELFLGPNDAKAARTFGGASAARSVADAATQDPFIMSAMGWTYYNLGREARDKKERDRCMVRAGDFFGQAVANDRRCVVAAQGLGIVLCDDGLVASAASSGKGGDVEAEREARRRAVDESLPVFYKLRELRDDGSIHVCLGHALTRREEWERASKAYEVAAKQYYGGGNPHVLTYLCFAEYHLGLQTKSYAHLLRSLERLQAARDLFQAQRNELIGDAQASAAAAMDSSNPRILSLEAEIKYNRYNEAVIKQKALQMLLDVRKEERSLEELRSAAAGIEQGLVIFQDLAPAAQAGQLNFITPDIIEQRIQFGESLAQRQAPAHIAEQETFEAEVAAKSEAVRALRLEKERARAEAARVAAEEEARRLEHIREVRQKAMDEAREFQYRLPSPEPVKKKSSRGEGGGGGGARKRRKRGASSEVETDEEERNLQDAALDADDEMILPDSEHEGSDVDEEARASRKRAKMEELRAARAAAKGKSGKGKKGKSSRKSRSKANGDAEDDDAPPPPGSGRKRRRGKKSLAVASDSDEDANDGGVSEGGPSGGGASEDSDDDESSAESTAASASGSGSEADLPRRKKMKKSKGSGGGGGGGAKKRAAVAAAKKNKKGAPKVKALPRKKAAKADLDLIDSDEEL